MAEEVFKRKLTAILSVDVEELLVHFLPRQNVNEEEVIFQLEQRHRQRQKAIESHARCQIDNAGSRSRDN